MGFVLFFCVHARLEATNIPMDFPHTCLAVCTFQTETTFLLAPIVLAVISIIVAVVSLLTLKENPWLVVFSAIFSLIFLVPLVGIHHEGGGCGSGCDKNSRTMLIQIWPWDQEPLWQDVKYGW